MEQSLLFEVSWEVCNKVGGIYTVLTSKVKEALAEFGDNYITMGPKLDYNPGFIQDENKKFSKALKELAKKNIIVLTGRWDVPGNPLCLLVDFHHAYMQQDKLLFEYWTDFGVDSMFGAWDYIEPVLFSTSCGMVIAEIVKYINNLEIYAHFHEWMTGAGLLYLKKNAPSVSTVLTTHATMLGRAMSGAGIDIYKRLDEINPQLEAKNHNISPKHSMETVVAREADCFCSVSDITALETKAFLGTTSDVTPNGFNTLDYTDYSQNLDEAKSKHDKIVKFASLFLGKELNPDKTKILATSGRYEFHNKGIDIFLDSLNLLNKELKSRNEKGYTILSLFLVIGGYAGVRDEARARIKDLFHGLEKYEGISTHHLGDPQHDPIVNSCKRLNLMNNPDDPVKIILIPVYLDGKDGVINMEYYDVLAGCDLSIFPSYYEPWGYTPLESAVLSVPTVTSDRGGFGKWIQNNFPDKTSGVHVLNLMGKNYEQTVEQLYLKLIDFVGWSDEEIRKQKSGARQIALKAIWKDFYKYYVEAYKKASQSKNERVAGIQKQREIKKYQTFFTGTNSTQPRMRTFSVITDLPKEIERLREVSYNLWWAWHSRSLKLFERIDPILWEESNHNPAALLEMLDSDKLNSIIGNKRILSHYRSVVEDFDAYVNDKSVVFDDLKYIKPESPVAYFSMEIGLHEAIRTYSGGLGILSGDHLKVSSDMNFPLVGVSLLYKYGYFRQKINRDGIQIPVDILNNFAQMPIDTIELKNSEKFLIPIDMPGRIVYAQVWKARVGRIDLYYLETDIEENSRADRDITSRLYEPRSRERIEQEIILGIGGVKLLNALAIEPSIYHLNEGHSAFLLIERIRQLMHSDKLDFDTAKEVVKSSTVFTMHTPVPAGNERFDKSLVENYFRNYIQEMGITWDEFWNLGHIYADDASSFTMTVLAIKLSNKSNAVSKLHKTVSRNMWKNIWPGFITEEIPIQHITNGVHVASWMSHEIQKTIESFTGISFEKALLNPEIWEKISDIPNTNLWQTHKFLKDQLFELVKQKIQTNWTREGESPDLIDRFHALLNPNALTIGFARRFATYKRPFLLFRDFERFKKILSDRTRLVQFIFAGKAHPADKEGADLITNIVKLSKQDEFLGKIIFLEGYNINVARFLVAGVDVWLNTPVRPLEASGTSGMKASLNGVINCSILDGWWDEAYNCENGWAIGTGKTYENPTTQDNIDSDQLYNLLEEKIIPTYYSRNEQNIPDKWIDMMKKAMISIIPAFNTQRMLKEYITEMYEPTAAQAQKIAAKKFKLAAELASWKKKIASRFSKLKILEVRLQGLHGDVIKMGTNLAISVRLECGDLQQDEFVVELVTLINGSNTHYSNIPIPFAKQDGNNLIYEITYTPERTGTFQYGVRVIPSHPSLSSKYETGLVYWS